jgi:hypothetical protein
MPRYRCPAEVREVIYEMLEETTALIQRFCLGEGELDEQIRFKLELDAMILEPSGFPRLAARMRRAASQWPRLPTTPRTRPVPPPKRPPSGTVPAMAMAPPQPWVRTWVIQERRRTS